MRPTFHVITNVWGKHHTSLFLDLTLPNVLSAGNLPALVRRGEVIYRFFTTPSSRAQIEASKIGQQLASTCQVEFATPLGDRTPDSIWHIHWFHRAAAEAKLAGSIAVFVPPDTLWTDGAFEHMAEHIESGKRAIACPFILVTSDTCISEAQQRFLDPTTGILTIPPSEMWPFVRRHIHPNHALAIPNSPHARPVSEAYWPAGAEGTLNLHAFRDLMAFDAQRCPLTFFCFADGPEDVDGIHFATEYADMLMLSVDPIGKYLENYILDHSATPFDVSRTTLHPLNDTKQTRLFLSKPVSVYSSKPNTSSWRRGERLTKALARDIRVGRMAMLICRELLEHGCEQMADLISVALMETNLSHRWRTEVPLTVFATRDRAFSAKQRNSLVYLMKPGREWELRNMVLDHVLEGSLQLGSARLTLSGTPVRLNIGNAERKLNDITITTGPINLDGAELYILDGVIAKSLMSLPPPPGLTGIKRSISSAVRRAISSGIRFLGRNST